jgi:aryl-alcohol dehydrogenase-like predicted oxidoreductase
MEYRRLGRSGLKVSPLCLGAMMFGDQTDELEAGRIVASARDAGVNFIDTADAYGAGKSEEIVGRTIGETVPGGCLPPSSAILRARRSRRTCRDGTSCMLPSRACAGSVPTTSTCTTCTTTTSARPLEETVRAMADLIRQGKIRYFGVSNFRAWRLAEVVRLCDQFGIDRPAASQPQYNAMNRMPEMEHLPACDFYGVGVVPYSPLARGVLTGKYASMEQLPEGSRAARSDRRMLQTELRPESIALAQEIKAHAEARGSTTSHFAVNWVLNNKLVSSVIAGPRTFASGKTTRGPGDAVHRRGRGAGRSPGRSRPPVHARFHRSAISGHRPRATHVGPIEGAGRQGSGMNEKGWRCALILCRTAFSKIPIGRQTGGGDSPPESIKWGCQQRAAINHME